MKCPMCDGTGTSNTCVNGTFKPCSFCDGTGEFDPNEVDRFNAVDVIKVMEMVKKPLTNFKRITASPEALAKWLEESIGSFCDTYNGEVDCEKCPIADDCDVIEQKRLKQLRDNSTDNISISDKDYWLAWLKQESDTE